MTSAWFPHACASSGRSTSLADGDVPELPESDPPPAAASAAATGRALGRLVVCPPSLDVAAHRGTDGSARARSGA